jgi:hypothetical protein
MYTPFDCLHGHSTELRFFVEKFHFIMITYS